MQKIDAGLINEMNPIVTGNKKVRSFLKFIKEYGSAYLMLAPNFILFLAFVLYPLLWALRYMFYDFDGVTDAKFIGIENFIRVFTRDTVWWGSVLNTFIFAFGKLIVEIPLAIVLAVLLNSKLRGTNFFRGVFFLPSVTSAAVMSLIFSFIFSPYNGIINQYLTSFGVINENINWFGSASIALIVCMLVSIWQHFGHNMLLVLAGLQNIPEEIYESAYMDGATKTQCFFKITLPMLAPMLQVICMLAIIGSLQTFDSIYVLTGGGPNHGSEVMAITIYNQFFSSEVQGQYGYGATLGFLSSIIIGCLTLIYLYFSKKVKEVF